MTKNSLLDKLSDLLKEETNIIYKKGCKPISLILLKKTINTIDTEKRNGVINKNFAQFRADELFVYKIISLIDLKPILNARSLYDNYFEYEVGKIVKAKDFDIDLDFVSGKGIHYFHSFIAAVCFGFVYRDVYEWFDGKWFNYNYNGQLISTHELRKGVFHGKQIDYDKDGNEIYLQEF